jgi:hypothetical protein
MRHQACIEYLRRTRESRLASAIWGDRTSEQTADRSYEVDEGYVRAGPTVKEIAERNLQPTQNLQIFTN